MRREVEDVLGDLGCEWEELGLQWRIEVLQVAALRRLDETIEIGLVGPSRDRVRSPPFLEYIGMALSMGGGPGDVSCPEHPVGQRVSDIGEVLVEVLEHLRDRE